MSVDDNTVAIFFVVSFVSLLLASDLSERIAFWGIRIFGIGWMLVIVWLVLQ
ncbi:MAG: hypothetical protein WDN46_22480 [Methylocella sp.]